MTIKEYIITKIKNRNKKTILFVDGLDKRAQAAAIMHNSDQLINSIVLLEKHNEEIANKINVIVIEDWKEKKDLLIKKYLEKRKGKATLEEAKKEVFKPLNFAMLLLELNEVDGVIAGLINKTSEVLRAGFKILGSKQGIKTISSIMLMEKADEWYIFGDISVNIKPTIEQLVDIAHNASEFAKSIEIKSKVAFLSFSTLSSAVHEESEKIRIATIKYNEKFNPKYKSIGEVQFDTAFSPEIRKLKYKNEGFTKKSTIFIFPDLNSGNIGYKIAQRMGGFGAIGPLITGINKPINDLSRGSTIQDVYNTALITAIQSK